MVPADAAFLWPEVRPHIKRALDREGSGRYLPEDVLRFALNGKVKLWVAWNQATTEIEAAIVTEIVIYPQLKDLRIWLVGGGNMRAWIAEARDTLEAFGRAQGCAYAVGAMRKGWLRVGNGYKQTGICFEKDLTK